MVNKEVVQIKTCELYDLLSVKCVDIMVAHKLISAVLNVIYHRYLVQTAKTPEAESLERWSLRGAQDLLEGVLCSMNLCELDRQLVRYVAYHVEYEEK